jgi:poly-beta-1,6-N-acetyl-D-glucosamine synthase
MNYIEIYSVMRYVITTLASIVLIKYFIYLVLAPLYLPAKELWKLKLKKEIKANPELKNYEPLVSVVIPAWNEEVGIITTIKSVLSNTYKNIEVIVINDGSTDNTETVVKNFIQINGEIKKFVKYYSQSNAGKGTALNNGIKKSKGEIILTMDADSAHDTKAIENLVRYFQDPTVDALVGNVKVTNTHTIVGLLQKLEYIFGFYFKRVHSIFNAEYIFGGACAAFRKKTTFDKLGLFDTQNKTEDIEYSMRIKLNGLKAVYGEDVITYTEGASDLVGLYKQRLRWKKGRIDTFIKYKELFFSTNPQHSKFLSFVVLPFAVLGEFQLFLEPAFFTLVWTYTLLTGDFVSVTLSSLFIFFTFFAAIALGDKKTNIFYLLLFPAFWLAFYVLVFIEFLALNKSIELALAKKEVTWQQWNRKGVGYLSKVSA